MATFVSFGTNIGNIIGSPLCGSPISVKVQAMSINPGDDDVLSFHRLIIEVKAGISSGDYVTESFSSSVNDGEIVEVDISSALRSVADAYEYTPDACTYPLIAFQVKAYDDYRLNGEMKTGISPAYLPSNETYYYALQGKFSDMERLLAGYLKSVKDFSRKPITSPQVVCVGENYAYTPSFSKEFDIASLNTAPMSKIIAIETEGLQSVPNFGRSIYALPASQYTSDRYEFRFINGLGVLDSFSCYSLRNQEVDMESNSYALTTQENFGTFSRGVIRKGADPENLSLTSGPLDKDWADWFIHEFLKAEHVWVRIFTDSNHINSLWVRCNISTDDNISGINRQKNDIVSISFSCILDINGSINHNLAI